MEVESRLGAVDQLESIEFSSIGKITLPNTGKPWHLVKIQLVGGSAAGAFTISPDGVAVCHFPVTAAGWAEYDIDWIVPGTNIPSSSQGTEGTAPARINLIFAPQSLGGKPITAYRAIFITAAPTAANTTAVSISAVTFDVSPGQPRGVIALVSAGNAQVIFPAQGGPQYTVEAMLSTITSMPSISPGPALPKSQSLALSYTNSAAATLSVWVFYGN